jgi:myo-inositol 2-dehydrogenase/D-chiro-inositol 1-dehydrogenase
MAGGSIRVGFLGAGLIATFHSKMLRRSGEAFERAGVYDPDPKRAEEFARNSGSTVCATEEEVLDSCDAVYICTWTSEHPRLVDAAAERGLAVFCEKPLATTLDGARAMAQRVAAAGIANQVGLVLRRSPAFTMLRELAHAPEAGRIMSVVFRDDQFIPIRGSYSSTWRGEVDKVGAGALLEHSIHDVDILEATIGPIADVSARSAEFHGLTGIEDLVVANLAFADGAIGSLTSIWHDIDSRGSLRRLEVFCERALFTVEGDWFGPLRWERDDGTTGALEGDELVAAVERLTPGGEDLNPDGAFLRAVRDGRPCHPDFATAVRAHEVTEAIYESARRGGAPIGV